jgi:predicted MFS family arabinose efflux permease
MFSHLRHHPLIHQLGLSQILAYGALFYAFASIKTPLAEFAGSTEQAIINGLSVAFLLKALSAPWVGKAVDQFGAVRILSFGLLLGGFGFGALAWIPDIRWIWLCLIPIAAGYAMATYEVAFGAAVQYDETQSRLNISVITFYGGVASSCIWLFLGFLIPALGIVGATMLTGGLLMAMGLMFLVYRPEAKPLTTEPVGFQWSGLTRAEKRALGVLAAVGTLDYVVFGGVTLLFITWFSAVGFGAESAVLLAAIYGPFQVIGRVIEMRFGHQYDARLTGLVAVASVPTSLAMLWISGDSLFWVCVAMACFGMANGVITVTNGYVVNMYFRAEVYGRAKGLITAPKALGSAVGPAIGVYLYQTHGGDMFLMMSLLGFIAAAIFVVLLVTPPRSDLPERTG